MAGAIITAADTRRIPVLVETSQLGQQLVDPRPMLLVGLVLHHGIVQILDAPQRIREPRHHRRSGRQLAAIVRTTVVSSFEIFQTEPPYSGGLIAFDTWSHA